MTFVRPYTKWGFSRILRYIDVLYLILLETVPRNMREFTYMMSTAMLK